MDRWTKQNPEDVCVQLHCDQWFVTADQSALNLVGRTRLGFQFVLRSGEPQDLSIPGCFYSFIAD
eukprot:5265621-Amphidinium_carterae.1